VLRQNKAETPGPFVKPKNWKMKSILTKGHEKRDLQDIALRSEEHGTCQMNYFHRDIQ
jgi:hypothetical protein